MASTDYTVELPTTEQIKDRLQFVVDYWKHRDEFIRALREMATGQNPIQAPTNTKYKIQTMHTYLLAGNINEKAARFMSIPEIQVIPGDILSDADWQTSSELEQALYIAFQEMERNGAST